MANAKTTPLAHTPGPWSFDPVELIVHDGPENNSRAIATIEQRDEPTADSDETSANGWLIAAAPELLHVARQFQITCEDRLSLLRDDEKEWRPQDEWEDMVGHYTSLLNSCRRALAKSQGRA